MFLSLEGPDGSGKTTQIKKITNYLTSQGYDVVTTREPGGCPLADKIRALLLQRDGGDWQKMSEVLLLFAARLEHLETIIKPALKENKIVISDRFSDSTYSYQGYGYGLSLDEIKKIEDISINSFKPDLTLILDIDVREGLERTGRRFDQEDDDSSETEDRYERMEIEFHENLRKGYLDIAQKNPVRCRIVDASREEMTVFEDIKKYINEFIENNSIGGSHVSIGR